MRTFLRLLCINLLVLLGLLLALELGYRTVKFTASCVTANCDRSYWVFGNKFRENVDVGLTRPHATLGYIPNDGDYQLDSPDSGEYQVTIRHGVRVNGIAPSYRTTSQQSPPPFGPALAIGDSFTFGDEVSDSETWPACLEQSWRAPVVNGGVFGYGGAQAVLRARELEREQAYELVIWSILLHNDFDRDRLVARSSGLRPAVISDANRLRFTSLAESQQVFERMMKRPIAKYAPWFGFSYLTKIAWQRLSGRLLPAGTSYDGRWAVQHPQAPPLHEVMRFAFDEFAALHAADKRILIQYPEQSFTSLSAADRAELERIKALAAERDLQIIDSLPALRQAAARTNIYQGHHTPAGNRAVCAAVLAALRQPP